MSRDDIVQRFGKPLQVITQGREEIWNYVDSELRITFSPDETLISWTLAEGRSGKPFRLQVGTR